MALVLLGAVLTMDEERPELADGAVCVGDDGMIEAVAAAGEALPAGFARAPRVRTRGMIAPGLIDLHGHLAYNCRGLWSPPRAEPYTSREQWPGAETYADEIRYPSLALGKVAGAAVLKYVEVKAIVGGTTSVQGSARLRGRYEGWMVRNVEQETFGTGEKTIGQSVRTLGDDAEFAQRREEMDGGRVFVYHLSEGTRPSLLREWEALRDHGVLHPRLVAIHCTALGKRQFDEWGPRGGTVVWSPFSNLWLYRATTDVVAARDAGLRVCLGADWAPSGSKQLLGELKVADLWNRERLGGAFSDHELCRMVTASPAEALGWEDRLGRVAPGLHADLVVLTRRDRSLPRSLIRATERDVRLVLIDGRPLYGTPGLMRSAGADGDAEAITVAGLRRAVRTVNPALGAEDLTWRQTLERLALARRDPEAALAMVTTRGGPPPVEILPDMPWDEDAGTRGELDLATVRIPKIDSLHHDAGFFAAVAAARIHGGTLDGMRAYWE